MIDLTLLWDIGLVIVSATFLAYLAHLFRQPLIIAYVFAGILIGPLGFGLISEPAIIKTLSELGIAFLLFIVGLELDLRKLVDIGAASVIISLVKSVIFFGLGFVVASSFGYTGMESIYIGLVMSFSSTMIVVKLLLDKNELDTLHGRLMLGILLTEDVLAILALSILTTFGSYGVFSMSVVMSSMLKGLGLFSIAIVTSVFVLPSIFRFVSKSQELLFLTALCICFIFGKLAVESGFSVAIGFFIAGVGVATFPYNLEIASRIRSLRDFFATIFFVSLGMEIWFAQMPKVLSLSIIFILIILLVKPLVIMTLTSIFGYGRRASFLTSIGLTQISEFSLIIVLTGLFLGHVSQEIFSLTALVAIVTITATSYLIYFDNLLYRELSPYLIFFERLCFRKVCVLEDLPVKAEDHIIVAGCHRMGYDIIKTLQKLKQNFLVVDFNPDVIESLMERRISCIYGDIGDMEILERVNLATADIVISTIPDENDNMLIIKESKQQNPKALVFVAADTLDQALKLYNFGADYVILPRMLSGEKVSEFLEEHAKNPNLIEKRKRDHILALEERKEEELLDRYEPSFLKSLERKFNGHHRKK